LLYLSEGKERERLVLAAAKTSGLAGAPVGLMENRKVFIKLANEGAREPQLLQ